MWRRATVLTALALVAGGAAAEPGRAGPVSVTQTAFKTSECDQRVYESEVSGLDARIIDVVPFAGNTVRVTTSANTLVYVIYDADCQRIAHPASPGSGYNIVLPANAAWLVVHGREPVDLTAY